MDLDFECRKDKKSFVLFLDFRSEKYFYILKIQSA